MIVGSALIRAEVDVGQDAKAEVGVLVKYLSSLSIVGAQMAGHKFGIDQDVFQALAHPFNPVGAGVGLENGAAFRSGLFDRGAHFSFLLIAALSAYPHGYFMAIMDSQ